ncbi:hypothetical protein GQ457_05G034750 [Hibiscus cannabinus]
MEPRKEQEIQRRSEVSLFVENIPRRMHWKGLWHLFARHGDVTATFIAGKLSRGGKRFGFVRFGSEVEAMRAMERLNGCMIYGFLLTVKLAIQKVRTGGPQKQQISDSGLNAQKVGTVWKSGGKEEALDGSARKKKIPGHVEDEELWKMKRCLIGEMATVCSVSSIASRLQEWGLNDIKYSETSFRSLGEKEILGNSTSPYLLRSFGNQEEVFGEDKSKKEPSLVGVNDVGSKVLSWADIVSVGINDKQVHVGRELGTTKILDDAAELGTTPSLGFEEPINITCRVRWADVVNEITKTQGPATEEARMGMSCDITNKEERLSGWESGGTFFPELETLDCSRKTKSKKRYGSLLEFQDRVLSRVEKSRRDRNLRRNKISKSELEHSDLSGRSLSDSDLHAKWVLATKEAKESLKLGKKLGMKIQGNESEVVRELTLIETT